MEFWPFLTFFIDCGYIHVPKGAFWGSTSSPHMVMSLFFTSGSSVHDWGWSKCFWPFTTLLGPSGLFWTITNKNDFFGLEHLRQTLLCPFGQKIHFCLKWFKGTQKGPEWSRTPWLTIVVPFGPFWTTLECWQACHVWPVWIQNGPFLGHP